MLSPVDASISALGAFGLGMRATANNIANVNTNGFKSSRVDYETGPAGQGVRVGAVSRGSVGSSAAASAEPLNDVSLEREFTGMISLENAYTANAVVIRTTSDMIGTVLDMLA
jgi:flagellar basal-body rod protein FlgC